MIKDILEKKRDFILEFMRYLAVGFISFLADYGALTVSYDLLLNGVRYGLYLATAIGFVAGLAVNYVLSLVFVFLSAKGTNKGRTLRDMIVFAAVGVIGLGFTELGMYLLADRLGIYYKLTKVFMTGLVTLWNYFARKILIFDKKTPENDAIK